MNNYNQKIFLIVIVVIVILVGISIFFIMNIGLISSENNSETSFSSQYDELGVLKSNYGDLEAKFNATKQDIFAGSDKTKEKQYINAELELLRAGSAIDDVESALKLEKSSDEVDTRLKTAEKKLNIAIKAYDNL